MASNESSVMSMKEEMEALAALNRRFDTIEMNTDAFFLIIIAIIIFFMQCGFAFLEAGAVRTKNTVNILIKNMLDVLIGGVAYWAIGFAVAYGPSGNGFIGGSYFFSLGMEYAKYPTWVFQYVFAATAATIVSGSIAERCQFSAYFLYSILITGWVYPIISHWCWDGDTPGFLNAMGYADFAGSGVVHLTGGTCGLVGCIFMGARTGRFDDNGKPLNIPGHSVPLAALGGFILLFGFLAFNGGSQASITQEGDADAVARAVLNTILGGCSCGLTVLFINKALMDKNWSYLLTLNGALAGMVSMCGGCNVYQPWTALLVGIFAGLAFLGCRICMLKVKLDDPLDAVGVHAAGGLVGLLCVPIFSYDNGLLFGGESAGQALLANIVGAVCIILWSVLWSTLIFLPMRLIGQLRVSSENEFRGMDLLKHGESAYPADAWVELQYNRDLNGHAMNTQFMPNILSGTQTNKLDHQQAHFNNAFEMVPAGGELFKGIDATLGSVSETIAGVQNNK